MVEQRVWTFAVPRYSPESTSEYNYILLERASNREIKRFVEIKSEANPFAPEWQRYFEERETDKMRDTLNGRVKLLNIFQRQKGLCAACGSNVIFLLDVYICSSSLLKSKTKQYPSHYGSSRTSTYEKHIAARKVCADCISLIKGFFWTNGGKGVFEYINGGEKFTNKYGSNGCPDKGANSMLTWLKSNGCKNGKIDTMPDVPGILLFKSGHVGVYIGDGWAVEAQGFNYGIVKTKVSKRPWTEWAYLPESLLVYDGSTVEIPDTSDKPAEEESPTTYKLGSRTLKYTSPQHDG